MPHKDPVFGLDYAVEIHFNAPSVACHPQHHHHDKTFSYALVSQSVAQHCGAQTVHSIFGLNWSVEPMRLAGMEACCGKGIFASDAAMRISHSHSFYTYSHHFPMIIGVPAHFLPALPMTDPSRL